MIDEINELPEDGLKRHENTWFSQKIKISCTFLHFTGILNDLIHFKSFMINLLLALFNSKLLI